MYWVVEPDQKLVSVFLLQDNQRFNRPEMYTDEDIIEDGKFPELTVELGLVFG